MKAIWLASLLEIRGPGVPVELVTGLRLAAGFKFGPKRVFSVVGTSKYFNSQDY